LLSPITYKCPLRVLCPVRTLNCVQSKDNNRALIARSGLEINSQACLSVLQGPRHDTNCWLLTQRWAVWYSEILLYINNRRGCISQKTCIFKSSRIADEHRTDCVQTVATDFTDETVSANSNTDVISHSMK
jgi:hypothetical protein